MEKSIVSVCDVCLYKQEVDEKGKEIECVLMCEQVS